MKIDLREYGVELGYWIEAFGPFVDRPGAAALGRLKQELETARDDRHERFPWKLAKPIVTVDTDRYDGATKTPHKVRIGWQFHATIRLTEKSKRNPLWEIEEMATHIYVRSSENDQEIMHFHHDLKNRGQLGPQTHMQLSEQYQKDAGRIPIAVPRFPSLPVLPTDCLDFALCEFFPFIWPEEQAKARGIAVLQNRQRTRLLAMAKLVADSWKDSRKTPIAVIQECYSPELRIA